MGAWGLFREFVLRVIVIAVTGCAMVKTTPDLHQSKQAELVQAGKPNTNNQPHLCEVYYANFQLVVFFDPKSSRIDKKYQREVAKMAEKLNDYPAMKLKIKGYTDDIEVAKTSLLSQARADAVMKSLVMDYGIDPNRISSSLGYGYAPEEDWKNSESLQLQRALNRRTVFKTDETWWRNVPDPPCH